MCYNMYNKYITCKAPKAPHRQRRKNAMKKSAQTVIREGACYTIAAANGRVLEVADFNTENGASSDRQLMFITPVCLMTWCE